MSLLLTLTVLAQLGGLPHCSHAAPVRHPPPRHAPAAAPRAAAAGRAARRCAGDREPRPTRHQRGELPCAGPARDRVRGATGHLRTRRVRRGVGARPSAAHGGDGAGRCARCSPTIRRRRRVASPSALLGERHYDVHVYQRPIFPLAAGRFVIPPARLVYAMPLTYSFFSREESFESRSDSVVLVAIEPPRAGPAARLRRRGGALRALAPPRLADRTGRRSGHPHAPRLGGGERAVAAAPTTRAAVGHRRAGGRAGRARPRFAHHSRQQGI